MYDSNHCIDLEIINSKIIISIGATGGSETRVFGEILRHSGIYIGKNFNNSYDSIDLISAISELALKGENLLEQDDDINPSPEDINIWHKSLQRHFSHHSDEKYWGWKNPRSMFLLPYSAALFPEMRFIHVIRDGREMATSSNSRQYDLHVPGGSQSFTDRAAFWARSNIAVAEFGRRHLASRYIRVRYEDLVLNPIDVANTMIQQLDLPSAVKTFQSEEPITPRQRRFDLLSQAERDSIEQAAMPALIEFGYVG